MERACPPVEKMTKKFWTRRLSVWPFHAWALVAVVLGGVFVVGWWPARYPDEGELVKISGQVATVAVRDDFVVGVTIEPAGGSETPTLPIVASA